MSDRVFLDTNILVYAYDKGDRTRQARAQSVLRQFVRMGTAIVSAQVLGEFFVTVTGKIAEPMSAEEALGVIRLLRIVPVVEIDRTLVEAAVVHHQQYGISFWDALIIGAAERGGCGRVLSAGFNHGQQYGRVIAEDPFVSA